MGAVTGMLGLGGGASGTGFAAPAQANITNPVTAAQLSSANTGTTNSLQQQQALLQALQQQNGLGNQSQVYNQLQGVANGTGPNPAQAMLAQSTGANVANQAALMAGQRGASANVGEIARQAGQQGANTQQQAAGQAATMQANQSLNAISAAGNMANTQAAQQVGQTNANTSAQQAYQNALLGAQGQYNQAQVGSQQSVNTGNAALAGSTMQAQQGILGGVLGGVGSALMAMGGEVKPMAMGGCYADGGSVGSSFGNFLDSMGSTMGQTGSGQNPLQAGMSQFVEGVGNQVGNAFATPQTPAVPSLSTIQATPGMASRSGFSQRQMAKGGKVPALTSPGEVYLKPEEAKKVVKDGKNPIKEGEKIPGKPKYPGNDYRNDVVPKKLDEGGVVIPNEVMQSDDPAGNAYKFVMATLAKNKTRKK
jgi:hypothetical protein